jgi:uncharacterized membrane protein
MAWVFTALLAAIISSVANIVDSHLVSKKLPSLYSFLIPMGITQLIVCIILFISFPFKQNMDAAHILIAVGAAIVNTVASILILNALRKSEVSRVIPVISAAPIFVALLSIPLLGDRLGIWQWVAILMTVLGAVLISLQTEGKSRKTKLQKTFFLLVLIALMAAIGGIGFKYALEQMSFWNMYSINGLCISIVVLTYSLRKENIQELKNLEQRTQKFFLVAGDQLLGITSGILAFKAMGMGPISLVNALLNVRPAFVFVFSLLLSLFLPNIINDRLTKNTAVMKFAAIVLMTAGIVIISLSS